MRQSVLTREYDDEVQRFFMNAAMALRAKSGIPHDRRVRMQPYVRLAEELFLTSHRLASLEIFWSVPARTKAPQQWFNLLSGVDLPIPPYDGGSTVPLPWYKKFMMFFKRIKE